KTVVALVLITGNYPSQDPPLVSAWTDSYFSCLPSRTACHRSAVMARFGDQNCGDRGSRIIAGMKKPSIFIDGWRIQNHCFIENRQTAANEVANSTIWIATVSRRSETVAVSQNFSASSSRLARNTE